jgi:hypothetical protein
MDRVAAALDLHATQGDFAVPVVMAPPHPLESFDEYMGLVLHRTAEVSWTIEDQLLPAVQELVKKLFPDVSVTSSGS